MGPHLWLIYTKKYIPTPFIGIYFCNFNSTGWGDGKAMSKELKNSRVLQKKINPVYKIETLMIIEHDD